MNVAIDGNEAVWLSGTGNGKGIIAGDFVRVATAVVIRNRSNNRACWSNGIDRPSAKGGW